MNGVYYILPMYNEALNLPGLFKSITEISKHKEHPDYTIIIVNDGSTDNTKEILETYRNSLPIEIVEHETNQGLGSTIRDGLAHFVNIASANSIAVSMDADQSHEPKYVIPMLKKIKKGYDIAIASRYEGQAKIYGLSKLRILLSQGAGLFFSLFIPIPGVRDYTCGFRAYRMDALKKGFATYNQNLVSQRGFECMAELLIKLSFIPGIRFTEVSFDLRYDQKKGESKMRITRTVYKTIKIIFLYGILKKRK